MTKTLEERIASMKWTAETDSIFVHTTDPKEDYSSFGAARGRQEQAKEAMKIIEELQAKNQALLAKNEELELKTFITEADRNCGARDRESDKIFYRKCLKNIRTERDGLKIKNQALQKKLDEALAKLNEVENDK